MKPKLFIGSSVEGINIAYAIQQNLLNDAEVTVWDQGVFELSKTTIESLIERLNISDFGIFVFTADDVTTIRKDKQNTVRDNVLFEFGLFIGKLSRERVYFIIPTDAELHLPTDLLGITPGKYESNREDGSMQAATGPISNQIRQLIKKLGRRIENEESAKSQDEKEDIKSTENNWIKDFFNKEYDVAKKKLEEQNIKEQKDDIKNENEIWIAYCVFKKNEIEGENVLDNLLEKHKTKLNIRRRVAEIFLWEDYVDKAIKILNQCILDFENDTESIKLLADCIKKTESSEKAMELLNQHHPEHNIQIALKLTSILEDENDLNKARDVIHKIYMRFPNNEDIRYKYSRIALELNDSEVALYLLNSLTIEYPDKYEYWGYLSNAAVQLDFHDLSMRSIKKAEELSKSQQSWIISNIGNILNNRGLYTDARIYLEKSIELMRSSEYAHNRLASTIKNQQEEKRKIEEKGKEGLKKIRNYLTIKLNE